MAKKKRKKQPLTEAERLELELTIVLLGELISLVSDLIRDILNR